MRKAFGIIEVLIIIIIMSGILALTMRYLKITIKHTADSYQREEAELFLRDAIELSLYTISGYPRIAKNNCLSSITINSPVDSTGFSKFRADINITTYYLLRGSSDVAICKNGGNHKVVEIDTEESHGMVMLEVVVTSNPNHPKNRNRIRLIRRTMQRI